MSSSDDTPKSEVDRTTRPDARVTTPGQDAGSALRSIYQQTVEEAVPDEMMELLGKLG